MITTRFETPTDLLVTARAAARSGDWETSYAAFSRAGAVGPLSVDDLDIMATAAWRLGDGREASRIGELVYLRLTRTDPAAAATKAAELGSVWLSRGEVTVGRNWIRRARALVAGTPDGPVLVRLTYLETVVAVLSDDIDLVAERTEVLREMSSTALDRMHPAVAGEAYYQLGEVRRRRGDVDGALAAYAAAHRRGVSSQPGVALVRCALGDVDTARAEVRAALQAATADVDERVRLLRGAVEIALAGGHLDVAEQYFHELVTLESADSSLRGAILVRRGRYREGLTALRAALREPRIRRSAAETAQVHRWIDEAHRGLVTRG